MTLAPRAGFAPRKVCPIHKTPTRTIFGSVCCEECRLHSIRLAAARRQIRELLDGPSPVLKATRKRGH